MHYFYHAIMHVLFDYIFTAYTHQILTEFIDSLTLTSFSLVLPGQCTMKSNLVSVKMFILS